jgi:hypothetical protein
MSQCTASKTIINKNIKKKEFKIMVGTPTDYFKFLVSEWSWNFQVKKEFLAQWSMISLVVSDRKSIYFKKSLRSGSMA